MTVAILGDSHFGLRGDSLIFHEHLKNFYTNFFFPKMKELGIKKVFQLGDLFDRRKYINFNTLQQAREYFFDPLKENDIQLITLLGNHDIFWKESLAVSSSGLLLKDYDNITLIDHPTEIDEFAIVPWICEENEKEIFKFMKKTSKLYCLGHFEIAGFSMYAGQPNETGLNRKVFDKFDMVYSGHFHHHSRQKNITYVGTPYEMTWQDFADPKGFYTFPDNKFHINPEQIFVKINYEDKGKEIKEILNRDFSSYKNKYVKLIVGSKTNPYLFEKFMNGLYESNPADVHIVEEIVTSENDTEEVIDEVDDPVTILKKYIKNSNIDNVDNNKLNLLMQNLYHEALTRENQ